MKLWLAAGNGDLTFALSARIIQSPNRKTIIQNETGGFEHAVSSGREQKPNVLSAEPPLLNIILTS